MNYLGHSFFSKNKTDFFITGNILGDFYKGRPDFFDFPKELTDGIIFHRQLDKTTDENINVLSLKNSLLKCGLFKGVVIDIYFDYFFAKNWVTFNESSLENHCSISYEKIENSFNYLPDEGKKTFRYMEQENWLLNYRNIDFIEEILYRMGSFYKNGYMLQESILYLKKDSNFYEDGFFMFLENMRTYFKI